jgi:hypothetical protein
MSQGVAESGPVPDDWATIVWLEWGLAQHHFQEDDNGNQAFKRAQQAQGLQVRAGVVR